MKRLELGDDYVSSDTEDSAESEEEDDTYGEESYGDEEGEKDQPSNPENLETPNKTPKASLGEVDVESLAKKRMSHRASNANGREGSMSAEQMNAIDDMFNPLRYIALNLKELNESSKT